MRAHKKMITFEDAKYMADNEGFVELNPITPSKECMTKADILYHMNADATLMGGYLDKNLVPYHVIKPFVAQCGQSYSGQYGYYVYKIDFGPELGYAGIEYNAYDVPDKFTIIYNGITYTTGYVGHSDFDQQLINKGISTDEINTGDPSTGQGYLLFLKDREDITQATIIVEGVLSGTGWTIIKGLCPDYTISSPTVPDDLRVILLFDTDYTLTWSGNSEDSYEVQYKKLSTDDWISVYVDENNMLIPSKESYYFRVRAVNPDGIWSQWSEEFYYEHDVFTESFSVEPTYIYFPYEGGREMITVKSNVAWTAIADSGLSIFPTSGGSGTTYVDVSAPFMNNTDNIITRYVYFSTDNNNINVQVTQDAYYDDGGLKVYEEQLIQ